MRIIARQKGLKKYYYLQHSARKDNRVITKEKYLGTETPKNISEIQENFARELHEDAYKKFERIKEHFQAEWAKYPPTVKEKEKEEIAIAFTYNTNAIEGSTITLQEAHEIIHDKIAPNKPLRDVREAQTHSEVFLEMLDTKKPITKRMLLEWHKTIFEETKPDVAGLFRDYIVRVGSYRAPDWQDVEQLMNQFVHFVNNTKIHPVELSARAHYLFEKIHPFGDGNGRIGRLLMNFILWHYGYPMLIIEYKKRRSYYKALEKDEHQFTDYFFRRYLSVHKKRILN